MLRPPHRQNRPLLITLIVCVIVALVYAPGFNGFWLGDDVPNMGRAYTLGLQGTLWPDTWRLLFAPVPSEGAFYRPMMILSLSVNYALFDAHYAGWYLINYLVHLANTLLIAMIVRRLAGWVGRDATWAALLAALFFGLSPALAEGVYWVSARSDGWVTLLSLAGLYLWAGTPQKPADCIAFALPMLTFVGLGFKESAAVVPLQILLLAIAWPLKLTRSQCWAIVATFVAGAAFLAWRTWLFGDAWNVYSPGAGQTAPIHVRLWAALQSLPPWWQAMNPATPILAKLYPMAILVAALMAALRMARRQVFVALALGCACGGLVLATILNLGGMSSTGEGGRLTYGPIAWLALTLGVMAAAPAEQTTRQTPWNLASRSAFFVAVILGTAVLLSQLSHVWAAQANLRALTAAVPAWTESHPGLTMLLVPENDGSVVLTRNAQGGIVLAPIQPQPYLHRVVPTLQSEVELRQDQFCNGLAKRLDLVRPSVVDGTTLKSILLPAETVWPAHIGCWSTREQRIIALKPPPMDSACKSWLDSIRPEIAMCGR